jgi:transposase
MGMKMKARCCDNSPWFFFDEHLVREQRAMDTVTCFVGLDYHQDSVQVCVLDQQGRQLLNRSCANDWRRIAEAVGPAGAVRRAAVEACCGAADLAEELSAKAGWHVDLAHPGYVGRMKRSPDKTDFSDGRMLADLTRVGYLPRVWLASAYERDLRQLVNHRQALVDQRRAAKLRVGAVLREHRAAPPAARSSRWTRAWVAWARSAAELSGHARWIVSDLLGDLEHLDKKVAAADARLREATRDDPRVGRLMAEPGVGEVTAWVLRAYVGRFDRFNSGKQLSRYCGLSPCNASSGPRQADAGLVRGCNKLVRATLIQAAHRLVRTEPRWRGLAASMRGRGKPACVVAAAVANRWARGLWHRMKQEEETTTTRK